MRAFAAALLALALLGAQSVARVHGLEHLAGGPAGMPAASPPERGAAGDPHAAHPARGGHGDHDAQPADGAHGAHGVHDPHGSLWGHEQGSGACLLLDELVSSQAPGAAAPQAAGPGPCQAAPDLARARAAGAAPSRPYLARAPPAG